jgi:hypothetical protein
VTELFRAYPCKGKCVGGQKCRCTAGHKAPHICGDSTCRCHHFSSYGLAYDAKRGVYVREGAPPAGVRVLEVTR